MHYEVIHFFIDLQDGNHIYNVGDKFPHNDINVNENRLNELSSKNNRQGMPLIVKVEEEPNNIKQPRKKASK